MGPGILTRYSKQVLGGILAVFAIIAAVLLYFRFRGPVGGPSPHETVNDLYEWEYMTFTAEQELYPADVETIRLYFRNDAPDGVVCLSARTFFAYELEFLKDGVWHSMRAKVERPRWSDSDTEVAPGTGYREVERRRDDAVLRHCPRLPHPSAGGAVSDRHTGLRAYAACPCGSGCGI